MNRRKAMQATALGLGSLALSRAVGATNAADAQAGAYKTKHSTCKWCYNDIPLEELCERGQDIGLQSIELLTVEDWPILKKYGMTCAMGTIKAFSIEDGWNEPKNHEKLQENYRVAIKDAADHGIENLIVMSGNRRRISDYDGMMNCAIGLRPMVKLAEEAGITLQMELLNSKVNHPDYMCDRTAWGVALAEMINSDHFKLLYDIYHMQIMEGDVIATIKKYAPYIGHYHTGGVPGRHEINNSQELNYPAIIRAIHESGFTGFIAQEYIPTYEDKIKALEEGLRICEV
ncbi:TIM barrel protein [Neolewinella lacunae]|uniref:TIM barrel protein n=1 Tax=Neolewinella lacunae TaxID=1517758 RepID=A0A923PMV4_9BACT|nr:TIM barrel protein [Neolewinella lacunae]MBC6996374.1 TIM barrel protein [Neolewinella lacunae]MDN3636997.1 TIM barrel protein [Neolewinella lacunae]